MPGSESVMMWWELGTETGEERGWCRSGSEPRVGMWELIFFFFQAEDGIRDLTVTGVQTCALPIWPLSPDEKAMIAAAARRLDETAAKQLLGVQHWVRDVSWTEALELLMSRPTVNIEGLVGGYTGPGGETILPHRAVAKLDLRLAAGLARPRS